ncbi:ABC transporter permease [Paenibacillus sp. ACRRX]|uniref:ABC transporter permease n=1 Tax=unclassified Paenibacillus TaxID=185978 RepID=UPI001EF4E1FB|nr:MULTISPECIES: ABC transporter permease [unclassified Paenibacillus]MCG7410695.1 ABC transporter permease [Paenibacillus sp. ACRRX]MDK8184043.1 ABC transporter permease [Paenibacillus sp. UMB4589-SE434]
MNRMRWTLLVSQLRTQKSALIALIMLGVYVLAALAAPLAPHDPNTIHLNERLLPPSGQHWFGTDDNGRDYFARALYGARVSLSVGILAMLVSVTIGTIIGAISGYFGGKLDTLLMRSIDIGMSLPSFFLMLILNAYLKPGVVTIVLIIGLLSWMSISRIVRAETISVKEREYVLYARVSGQSAFRIILRHIIPSIVPTIVVAATLNIAGVIMMESALSFLGLGISPPDASWGSMLNNAKGYIGENPTLALFPGLLILTTVLAFNYLGDVFRAAFEPKVNRR